jgi:hypothetical protein
MRTKNWGYILIPKLRKKVATVVGYQWYDPPEEELSPEEKKKNIEGGKRVGELVGAEGSMVKQTKERLKKHRGKATDIGLHAIKGIATVSASSKGSSDGQASIEQGGEKATASIGQKADSKEARGSVSAASDAGKLHKDEDEGADVPVKTKKSMQPITIAKGAGTAQAEKSTVYERQSQNMDNDDLFYSPNQVLSSNSGKGIDFKKLVEERKRADGVAVDDLPGDGEAADGYEESQAA